MKSRNKGLEYIAESRQAIPGIPARNLSPAEVKQYGGQRFLLATGIYRKPEPPKIAKEK